MRLMPVVVFTVAAILHVAAFPTFADETKTPPTGVKLDLYGDPLPAGASLRLGTVRLRHTDRVASIAFSPDGLMLASASGGIDPQIRLWDVRTGRLIRALVGSVRNAPHEAAFSPDGARLAVICRQGGAEAWDVASARKVWEKHGLDNSAIAVAFAPDGQGFATVGFDGTLHVWSTEAGTELVVLHPTKEREGPFPIAYAPDGKRLARATGRDIHIYDLDRRVEAGTIKNAHGYHIVSLQFGRDGKTLFSAGANVRSLNLREAELNGELRMWDVANRTLIRDFLGNTREIDNCSSALSRDGRTLVSMHPNKLLVWDVASGKVTRTIPFYWLPSALGDKPIGNPYFIEIQTRGIALSPDGTTIACACNPLHNITLWDVGTGREKPAFPDAHSAPIEGLACSVDGSRIATGGADGTVRMWDAGSGKQLRAFLMSDHFPCVIRSVAFARDGKTLVAAGHDRKGEDDFGFVRIWDAHSGAIHREMEAGKNIAKVAISSDGSKLAIETTNFVEFRASTGADDHEAPPERLLVIVDARTGAKRLRIKLEGALKCLALTPNGATISAVDALGSFNEWDVVSGRSVHQCVIGGPIPIPAPPGRRKSRRSRQLFWSTISADCTVAAVSWFDSDAVSIWDLAKGTQIGQVDLGNEGNLSNVIALSPDKRVIASAAWGAEDRAPEKHTLRLWDARSGQLLKRYPRPLVNRIVSMEFTPDGRRLITGMSDGTALLWAAVTTDR
jgi:WD40 repeat protein